MRNQLFMAALPLLALAACGDSDGGEDTAASDPLAALAAGTGPYLVTYPDGTQSISFAAEDGTEWGGPIDLAEDGEPVRWSVPDGQTCIDFPDSMADATDFCIAHGPLQEDGSWTVSNPNNPDAEPAVMRRLDRPVESEADQVGEGTYWVEMPDGNTALAIWAADGISYLAMNPTSSTWTAYGQQRCTTPAGGEERCGMPTSEVGEDGSFTAEDGGQTITVRML